MVANHLTMCHLRRMNMIEMWMRKNGWTRMRFGRETGLSPPTVQNLLMARRDRRNLPFRHTLIRVSEVTGIPVEQLIRSFGGLAKVGRKRKEISDNPERAARAAEREQPLR